MCEQPQKLWPFSPRHCSAWSGLIDAQVPQCALQLLNTKPGDSRFCILHHSQDVSHAVEWPLQPKYKDSWSIRPCKLPCIHWDVSLGLMHSLIFVSEWTVGASEGKSFQDHQWYCFYQLQTLLYMVSLCQRKNWVTWLLHSKFHNKYLWFSLLTLALCPENNVLVPSVCLPLLSMKSWVLFSFLSIALPLPDDDYDIFQTFVDCFKVTF